MKFKALDIAALNKDLPELGLEKGDLGRVVRVYEPGGLPFFDPANTYSSNVLHFWDHRANDIKL